MVFTAFGAAIQASSASYRGNASAIPLASVSTTEVGNVHIYANGTVSNSSAVQRVGNTNTYDLLTNIDGTLFIERNNTVVNGNGLTLTSQVTTAGAVESVNTTGITLENTVIGNSSYYGVLLAHVSGLVLENLSTVNYNGNSVITAYFSSNVTVENSNFTISSAYYAVHGKFDTSMNVSFNRFSGDATDFVYFDYGGHFSAYGNVVNSTYQSAAGFYLYYAGNSVFAYNSFNYTAYGIDVVDSGVIQSMRNTVTNYSNTAFSMSYDTSFTSLHDTATSGHEPVNVEETGIVVISNANFTTFTSYLYFEEYATVTISDSQIMNATDTSQVIYFYEGGPVSLIGDTINITGTNSGDAVYANYVSGLVNLAHDTIFAPDGTGLDLNHASVFSVTGSRMNITYGIYSDSYEISAATITNNTFFVHYDEYAVSIDVYAANNINFSNNTVYSAYGLPGYCGIYLYAEYSSSNITVNSNTFLNIYEPVYLEADYSGNNVQVNRNVITNSDYAIETYDYGNTVVTSNTIVNVSGEGIEVYMYAGNLTVTNNLVSNIPGYGGMSYGIDLEDVYGGNNVISNNTVRNVGYNSNDGYGMYLYDVYGATVYSNVISNSTYAFYAEDSVNILAFGNSFNLAYDYGIYSEDNINVSYYSNTITNANVSLSSYYDYNIQAFANTFTDTQANNNNLYFLSIDGYQGFDHIYHNNFINSTKNSVTANYFSQDTGILLMYGPLPVGGNYYSNYTGTGTNGIGSTPVNFMGGLQDRYPLLNKWTSPTVTFLENGLSTGTAWAVQLGGTVHSANRTSTVFQQTNGLYTTESYSVMNVPGYTASTTSGTVSLAGTSSVVTVTFAPVTYAVTFKESGLANGTAWSVTLNGHTEKSTTQNMVFMISNGSYTYIVGSVTGYAPSQATGTVSVSGSL